MVLFSHIPVGYEGNTRALSACLYHGIIPSSHGERVRGISERAASLNPVFKHLIEHGLDS